MRSGWWLGVARVTSTLLIAGGIVAVPTPASAAVLEAAPLAHDFGDVAVGTTAGPMATVLTNTSSDPAGPISMAGGAPATAEFSGSQNCQGVTLDPGESCQVTYTFTPSDIGPFTDTTNFSLTIDGVTDSFPITLDGVGMIPGSITIAKSTVDGDDTFSFSGDLGPFAITTVGGSGDTTISDLASGTYAVTEAPLVGWTLSTLTCNDADSTGDPDTATATIILQADEHVICTFTNAALPLPTVLVGHDEISPGETQTATGSGFQPGEQVTGVQNSVPLDLGTQTADADGVVTFSWQIRSDETAGLHTVVLAGAETGTATTQFTVLEADAVPGDGEPPDPAVADTTDTTDTTADPSVAPTDLPVTGAAPLALTLFALALALAGSLLLGLTPRPFAAPADRRPPPSPMTFNRRDCHEHQRHSIRNRMRRPPGGTASASRSRRWRHLR